LTKEAWLGKILGKAIGPVFYGLEGYGKGSKVYKKLKNKQTGITAGRSKMQRMAGRKKVKVIKPIGPDVSTVGG
jgi:hypothetical protein